VVIFISMAGPVTFIKRALLQRICTTSHLPVVVGYDAGQNASNINEVLSTRMSSHCPHEQIPLSFDALARRFEPHAASNFAGTPINSPSKLAPLLWLSKSRFSHMWHLEDDTWVNNMSKFVGQYATRRSDLVAHFVHTLPNWWHRGGWVGSKEHGLPDNVPSAPNYMSLACYRVSKTFAVALVTSITNDKTASHHEVYLPFVLNITRPTLSWSSLLPYHSPEVRFNPSGNFYGKDWRPLCELQKDYTKNGQVHHPVKSSCCMEKAFNDFMTSYKHALAVGANQTEQGAPASRQQGKQVQYSTRLPGIYHHIEGDYCHKNGSTFLAPGITNVSLAMCKTACDACSSFGVTESEDVHCGGVSYNATRRVCYLGRDQCDRPSNDESSFFFPQI